MLKGVTSRKGLLSGFFPLPFLPHSSSLRGAFGDITFTPCLSHIVESLRSLRQLRPARSLQGMAFVGCKTTRAQVCS